MILGLCNDSFLAVFYGFLCLSGDLEPFLVLQKGCLKGVIVHWGCSNKS